MRSEAQRGEVAFILLLALNAVLFIRPADLIPSLANLPFYEVTILACTALSLPLVLDQALRGWRDRPMNVIVMGLCAAAVLSHLSQAFFWGARHSGMIFAKMVLFYLLVVGLVDSPRRLKTLLRFLTFYVVILTSLAVLQYIEVINLAALKAVEDRQADRIDPETGLMIVLKRMCGVGIFNDPNDLCLILLFGVYMSLWRQGEARMPHVRVAWLLVAAGLLGALYLTHSRGGFLAMLASMGTLVLARFGWKRALLPAIAMVPMLFYLFSGRQTSINATEGTGLARIQLWSEALTRFKRAPIFGIGMDRFVEEVNLVVHNSFLQSFVELGMFGGTLFAGAFVLALWCFWRLARFPQQTTMGGEIDGGIVRLRPFLTATVVAYIVGHMTLSRSYSVPTYLLLAIVACYVRIATPRGLSMPKLGLAMLACFGVASAGLIAGSYLFIRMFVRWG